MKGPKKTKLMVGSVLVVLILLATFITVVGGGEPVIRRSVHLADGELPAELLLWVAENRGQAGFDAFSLDERVYVVARLGQKPTGGYAVFLGEPTLEELTLYVKVDIREPKPWDMVTQALTYPTAVIGLRLEGQLPIKVVFLGVNGEVLGQAELVNLAKLDDEPEITE